jgi:hypothetical protein
MDHIPFGQLATPTSAEQAKIYERGDIILFQIVRTLKGKHKRVYFGWVRA